MHAKSYSIERGFTSTIFGICLLVLSALVAKASSTVTDAEVHVYSNLPQPVELVFGVRLNSRIATNHKFSAHSKNYGVIGQTVQIEQQIDTFASMNPSILVKIWGVVQPAASDVPIIIVSGILADQPTAGAPVTTPNYPTAYVLGSVATIRNKPALDGITTAKLMSGQSCPVTKRLIDNSWWYISCNAANEGWVVQTEVYVIGSLNNVAMEGLPTTPIPTVAPTPTVTPTPFPTPIWRSAFFNNTSLSGAPVGGSTTLEPNLSWGKGSPASSVPADNFSGTFERIIDVSPGNYRFQVQADDGIRLYLDGQVLVDEFHQMLSGTHTYRADRVLTGQHSIRIEFVEFGGDAYLYFTLNPVIARSEWTVSYFNNTDLLGAPVANQIIPRSGYPIDANWGGQSPLPNIIAPDNWSTRWEGDFDFEAGTYSFYANSDDGVRVYFDGRPILDTWSDGVHLNLAVTINGITAGEHSLKVEQFERGGGASLRVWWAKNQAGGPQ